MCLYILGTKEITNYLNIDDFFSFVDHNEIVSAVTFMLAHYILSHIYTLLVGKGLYFNTKIVNDNNLNLC